MSAPLQTDSWLVQIENLQEEIESLGPSDDDHDGAGKELVRVLTRVCEVVRDAESKDAPNIDAIVQNAQNAIDSGVDKAYGASELFDFLPSFAHTDEAPLIEDSLTMPFGE